MTTERKVRAVEAYWRFLGFAAQYSLMKCLKTMFAGMFGMCVLMAVRRCRKNAGAKQYVLLLLFPLAFTGMSRLFYENWMVVFTYYICKYIQPIHGKCYFAVCAILLLRMLLGQRRVRRYVHSLPLWWNPGEMQAVLDTVTEGDVLPFGRWYLRRVRVYITPSDVSPFSGGIWRPYVVMPQTLIGEWSEEQRRLVLCHELLHIRQGHVLWLNLFQLLRIYWWPNPAIHFYIRHLREDMELACDERCVTYTGTTPARYGRVILDMLALLRTQAPESSLAFLRQKDDCGMKRRFNELLRMGGHKTSRRRFRLQAAGFAVAAILLSIVLTATSYPIYTRMTELVLYDEQLNMVDYDSAELREAAWIQDGRVMLDKERFAQLLSDREVAGEYVYLSFDTIMKVPGCGGGGNTGMISMTDYDDIFYLAADCMENRVMIFCLKYLL